MFYGKGANTMGTSKMIIFSLIASIVEEYKMRGPVS
jgi:hypothetical protein